MKLYNIIFFEQAEIEEAAKTASDAVNMDYALLFTKHSGQSIYVLVDTKVARAGLSKVTPGMWMFQWFSEQPDCIKGVLYLDENDDGKTWSIAKSAAVDGFGPLLYELAMSDIAPKYLTTDTTVTMAAMNVWTKFYERPDVSKIPLEKLYGNPCDRVARERLVLAARHIVRHMRTELRALSMIEARIDDCRYNPSRLQPTDEFFAALSKEIDLKYLPMLFGYTANHSNPGAAKILRNEGDILASEMIKALRINKKGMFASDLSSAASDFFSRLYK